MAKRAPGQTLDGWLTKKPKPMPETPVPAPVPAVDASVEAVATGHACTPSTSAPPTLSDVVIANVSGHQLEQLIAAGATVLDEHNTHLCTHFLCDDLDSAEAHHARATGVQVVDCSWVQRQVQGASPEGGTATSERHHTPKVEARTVGSWICPKQYQVPDDYVDAWDREHVSAPSLPPARDHRVGCG